MGSKKKVKKVVPINCSYAFTEWPEFINKVCLFVRPFVQLYESRKNHTPSIYFQVHMCRAKVNSRTCYYYNRLDGKHLCISFGKPVLSFYHASAAKFA